ncbi:hypothetical protein F5884DRAFT_668051 [Xylogone sp. PMI_703]|nr:hypothetical protein F5884DRAFT_668051 [Xylogone sp. PMI_703]
MAGTTQQYIKLAERLPPRLLRFFARYPPQAILPQSQLAPSTTSSPSSTPAAVDPAASNSSQTIVNSTPPSPFASHKHPVTGKWHDPVFSLRRQAELVKLARQYGVEELLPPTTKGTVERLKRRAENGLRVKGTGVGQRVKGKEAERTLKGRLEMRKKAMLEMPKMIQQWKERGHGRGWKKWPK